MGIKTKEELINDLIKEGYLKTPAIIEAFKAIDRKDFVPATMTDLAYLNQPLPIGLGQTISQPLTVAFMLELLQPIQGEKILDIGAGSGWQTALLAFLVGNKGLVIAIERLAVLTEMAKRNVAKYNFIEKGIAKVIEGDGSKGYPVEKVFDKIIAAAAAEKIPKAWKEQLKIGGRLVAPVGSKIVVLDKINTNEFKQEDYFGFSFVPLIID